MSVCLEEKVPDFQGKKKDDLLQLWHKDLRSPSTPYEATAAKILLIRLRLANIGYFKTNFLAQRK